ncbi:uncharacterized protein Yka (UPF0111/DUF47 family) [Desulfobotulus alkaliphilus]|uniref:Uncharacterized protein Yka (UPF0111/DUF47 family) n=1 Tax=Desulfobotulus alkaliphilus TaxID=622671 RepID=A0A562RB51_9BACT|nr:hypothetical protein [Desulfobotulus alkaliphilus]TWI65794.1 uncharacterized protein Yka (UPF0111/DUF47 family) [Desulfobotulus alkaliphilus]
MRLPGATLFIENPFLQTRVLTRHLKECAFAFQQAMECIISRKKDMALPFKEDVFRLRKEIQQLECDGILTSRFFRKLPIPPSLCYRYIRAHGRIALHMEKVLEWILVREEPVADPLETELFLLADAAGETVEELEKLSIAAGYWLQKKHGKNQKKVMAAAQEILDKTDNTQIIARRTKRKILESSASPASMTHLMELASLIERITDDSDEIARIVFFVLRYP